jgi:hypothetical protein
MTRRAIPVLVHVVCIVSLTGCASPRGYLVDRGRDAADIFTATVGIGGGVQMKVGPFPCGVLTTTDVAGIRYGDSFWHSPRLDGEPEEVSGMAAYLLACALYGLMGGGVPEEYLSPMLSYHNRFPLNETQLLRKKGAKYIDADSSCQPPPLDAPMWYHVEAVLGLGLVFRAGVNVGELLDFGLGWAEVDVLGDDIEAREKRSGGR